MNERISFPLNRKFVGTGRNKDSFETYFHEIEKLLPVERIFEESEENGFHQSENKFTLCGKKL